MVDLKKFSCGLFICAILAVFIRDGMAQQSSAQLEQQRRQFMQARNALRAKQMDRFKSLTDQLRDYPLYPYLLQLYLSSNLWRATESELIDFLERYGDLPTANDLRRDWLRYLAQHGRWQTFIDNYTSQNDKTLRCYHLHGRLQTRNHAYLLEDARSVWLSGKSLPPQCDTVFALLYKSDLFTEDLIWQRIRLAMVDGNTGLAKYLSGFLKGNDNQWARRWLDVHSNPVKGTQNPKFEDLPIAREILAYGIQRLVKVNIDLAISRWRELRDAYSFNSTQIDDIDRVIAINAASKKHAQAREILEQVRNSLVDEEIFHWRLATALRNKDWERLMRWTEGDPPIAEVTQRWRYWRARAYAATGNQTAAEAIHRITAQERDYYGFLAADELRLPYAMDHRSLPEDLIEWQKISVKPAIVRARELYLLGMIYSARREWRHAFHDLTSYQLQIAAGIAADWGWHDQVILTLGEANAHDDLNLRFPLPYEKLITSNAQKRQLELSWVYALTRAESIFIEDAQSPAGALGLMQVMPATGRETARILGIGKFMTSHLLEAATNVPIGTEYLRRMYERFNRNIVLATAAYNAGPGNVLKWLPENGCVEPEIWIEQIPFKETRKYVQRVLYFASIYDWRLGSEIKPVRARMAVVTSDKNRLVAGLNCTGERLAAIH